MPFRLVSSRDTQANKDNLPPTSRPKDLCEVRGELIKPSVAFEEYMEDLLILLVYYDGALGFNTVAAGFFLETLGCLIVKKALLLRPKGSVSKRVL